MVIISQKFIYFLFLGIFHYIKIHQYLVLQKKQKKFLKKNILQCIIILIFIKIYFLHAILLKLEYDMNGMHYNDGAQIIGTIFLSRKLFIQI